MKDPAARIHSFERRARAMNAYVYQAALLCSDCAHKEMAALDIHNVKDTGDSNSYPQGPYSDGGGEADSPQHCDVCREFLENSLTSDGYEMVYQDVCDWLGGEDEGTPGVLQSWIDFYNISLPDLIAHRREQKGKHDDGVQIR